MIFEGGNAPSRICTDLDEASFTEGLQRRHDEYGPASLEWHETRRTPIPRCMLNPHCTGGCARCPEEKAVTRR